jgi:hypothetical protein
MLGSGQTENGETGEEQSQATTLFIYIKEVIHKEFLLASQIIQSCYYYYYCDVLRRLRENVRRLR